ncbi:hypothetical protein O3M35_005865 [Rhynocoris fuscipes]|uniref:NADH dehydrogenase [ubiquinone] 1 beta subcomplex subunit 3 n=1 Tax=Rhynocoris fuscipes TaxID=488301 RepID=A0AAW1DRM7_9HEMI
MGGDHHHNGLGERMKIPDYRIYKVEDVPELVKLRDVMSQKGLRDPWLRNEVWRFNEKEWGTHSQRLKTFFFRGIGWGFAAFVVTIAVETAMKKMSSKPDDHHHH